MRLVQKSVSRTAQLIASTTVILWLSVTKTEQLIVGTASLSPCWTTITQFTHEQQIRTFYAQLTSPKVHEETTCPQKKDEHVTQEQTPHPRTRNRQLVNEQETDNSSMSKKQKTHRRTTNRQFTNGPRKDNSPTNNEHTSTNNEQTSHKRTTNRKFTKRPRKDTSPTNNEHTPTNNEEITHP